MKTFILRDGSERFYNLERYLSILDINYNVFDCDPNISNEEAAKQIFFKTGYPFLFILRENQIISSYEIKNILTNTPTKFYSIRFPKINYNYKIQDCKKILEPIHKSLFECSAAHLWRIENLSKSFDVTYEDVVFNMSADESLKTSLKNTVALIFQFNKTT